MPRVQYFGVAGVTTPEEASDPRLYPPGNPSTAIGVLAGLHTLEGRPPHNAKRYPAREEWKNIFTAVPAGNLGLLHYTGPNDDETLPAQLAGAMHWAGNRCNGIQLNIAWPSVKALQGFRISYPDKEVILQVGAKALRMAGHNPRAVALMVRPYKRSIDYVLIDPSGGTDWPITPAHTPYFDALLEEFGNGIGLAAAGGFGPDGGSAHWFLSEHPGMSFDAESRLRDEDDRLHLGRANRYLTALRRIQDDLVPAP